MRAQFASKGTGPSPCRSARASFRHLRRGPSDLVCVPCRGHERLAQTSMCRFESMFDSSVCRPLTKASDFALSALDCPARGRRSGFRPAAPWSPVGNRRLLTRRPRTGAFRACERMSNDHGRWLSCSIQPCAGAATLAEGRQWAGVLHLPVPGRPGEVRTAPALAVMTRPMASPPPGLRVWSRTRNPAAAAIAGPMLIKVAKVAALSRRSESSSRL